MSLTEREKKVLEDLARDLYSSESDVLANVDSVRRPNYRSVVLGILLLLVGVIMLTGGVLINFIVLSLAGFAVMFLGTLLALTRKASGDSSPGQDPKPRGGQAGGSSARRPSSKSDASFLQRLTDRWNDR